MIQRSKKGLLIVISAPSGSGKGTIINKLLTNNKNLWLSISTTSRNIRENDIPGETYNFVTKEEFEKKIQENYFLEYASYAGNYYGTPKELIEEKLNSGQDVILEIETVGAKNIRKIIPDAVFIFIMPPSIKELINRLVTRNTDSKEKIITRIKTAYQEISTLDNYDYVIENDDIDIASRKIETIIAIEKEKVTRVDDIVFDLKEEEINDYVNKI